jgi:hypothetical protein
MDLGSAEARSKLRHDLRLQGLQAEAREKVLVVHLMIQVLVGMHGVLLFVVLGIGLVHHLVD